MKKMFSAYYRPSENEFSDLWANCTFTFDANVLLNLYRYSPKTRDSLIEVLKKVSDRIWLPHQAGLEYHRNRLTVIQQQAEAYRRMQEALDDHMNKISGMLNGFAKHAYIDADEVRDSIQKCIQKQKDKLEKISKGHPNLIAKDPVMNIVTELFKGKVGEPFGTSRMNEIVAEGKKDMKRRFLPASWTRRIKTLIKNTEIFYCGSK